MTFVMNETRIVTATFNLRRDCRSDGVNRWQYRKNAVISTIRSFGADIIGVQELTPKMKKDIESELSEFVFIGAPRSKGRIAEHNDLLVRRDKLWVEESNTFWLSSTPDKSGSRSWSALFPRICTTAFLKDANGKIIRVMNTHFDNFSKLAREFSARLIKDRASKNNDGIPTIVMGDLNTTPDSRAIKLLTEGGFLRDAAKDFFERKKRSLLSTFHSFSGIPSEKSGVIDYILVNSKISIADIRLHQKDVDGIYPSDHFPIVAELTY